MEPSSASGSSPHDRLIHKLESISSLTSEEKQVLRSLPMRLKSVPEDTEVVSEGNHPTESCLVVEGFLCRYKFLSNGGRQILSIHIPGDLPDMQCLHLPVLDHSLGSISPCTLAFIPHPPLLEITKRYPGISEAFWRDTLIDAAIFREWLTGLGRRSARERIAHLMCEIFLKMKSVGLTEGDGCAFPINQTEIGDALGLSLVHTNRVLQELRRDGLIVLKGKFLTIPDWDALQRAALFDPLYLHLEHRAAA